MLALRKKLNGAFVSIWTGPLSYAKVACFPYHRPSTIYAFVAVPVFCLRTKCNIFSGLGADPNLTLREGRGLECEGSWLVTCTSAVATLLF